MITNMVTKAVFELLGDPSETGYSLRFRDKNIPIFLNKDATTQYPQIRVSPFIHKGDIKYQKYLDPKKEMYQHWQSGAFQIDIYTKNLVLAQNIYDVLTKRIFDFFNLETLIYDYNYDFTRIDDNVYINYTYALLDDDMFKDIYGITIDKHIIQRVKSLDDLKMNSFYVDNKSLYIKTNYDIKKIKIKMLLQGRLFSNGFAFSDNGLHDYALSKQRNLSLLEDNEVERISFDLEILFSKKINREILPKIDQITLLKNKVK